MIRACAVLSLLALCACSTLPHDGPSSRSASRDVQRGEARYALVDLDYAVTRKIADRPPVALKGLVEESSEAPSDRISEGDVLSVSVFEAGGGALFGKTDDSPAASSPDTRQTLPRVVVDGQGDLDIPFAGVVHVAGLTPREAGAAIRLALKGRVIDPQVLVDVVASPANSVTIIGEVRNAGRVALAPHADHLLDVLASAGGPTKPPADLAIVVSRGGHLAEAPMSLAMNDPAQNIRLAPRDQIRVVDRPRKYSTFGAFLHDAQTPIEDDQLNLADAISRAGGLDTYSANARSVLVFRFERPEVARDLGVAVPAEARGVPIVYRLNFEHPGGVFVADNFEVRSGDLLFVARSDITEMKKFFDLVNSVTQIGYNVRVTSTIP